MRAFTSSHQERPLAWASGLGLLALLAALVGIVALGQAGPADAAKAKQLGKTKKTPKPDCPGNPCFAVGSVTGFQSKVPGKAEPFKLRKGGRVVAWSVSLSKPDKEERKFFEESFGTEALGNGPSARLAVLKEKKNDNYKLVRQSPVTDLKPFYGRSPLVTLDRPLKVKKGHVLGITYSTWAPGLASREGGSRWVASRKKGRCGGNEALKARPQQKVGSTREYGCRFADRLLYWAYLVPGRN